MVAHDTVVVEQRRKRAESCVSRDGALDDLAGAFGYLVDPDQVATGDGRLRWRICKEWFDETLPHHYKVASTAGPDGEVVLSSADLESMHSAPPVEFDGPGDRWSPETLLITALADCFVLTFRAIARASKLPWVWLHCEIEGTLEREAGVSRFTVFELKARLGVPAGTDVEAATRAMHKAEQGCLISNSLSGRRQLTASEDIVA